MGGAGCTAGTSLALGGTIKEMMVVVWRGYTWHDGGEDHLLRLTLKIQYFLCLVNSLHVHQSIRLI